MKENILQDVCFQELQDGTGIDYACSSWKLLPVKVGLSPFLLMDLYLILQYSHHLVLSFSKYRGRIE